MPGDGVKSFFGFDRFYSSGATLLALVDRLAPPNIDIAERLRNGDTPAQLLGRLVAPVGDVGDLLAAARAEHDPDNQLEAAAVAVAGLAAAEGPTGFADGDQPGDTNTGSEASDDEAACLQEHGLDLSEDSIIIPDDIALACINDPGT